jgi:5,10-methylenetetrahydrofolate reductase
MVKVTEHCRQKAGAPYFICDYSPPKSGDANDIRKIPCNADFISVNSNPGLSVRANAVTVAAKIQSEQNCNVIYTITTRDMNRLALDSLILGSSVLGLQNVIVVRGDDFPPSESTDPTPVNDYMPTELISSISRLNKGVDFRDMSLESSPDLCIGAVLDLSNGISNEADLACRKVSSGAEYFITQPTFDVRQALLFCDAYKAVSGRDIHVPIFWGIQIPILSGVSFTQLPEEVINALHSGETPIDIALRLYQDFRSVGLHNTYVVPTIQQGGHRDYALADQFMATAKSR